MEVVFESTWNPQEIIFLSADVDNLDARNDFFSGLDVLVNSAGILMSGSVETLDVADYDKVNIEGCVINPKCVCITVPYTGLYKHQNHLLPIG